MLKWQKVAKNYRNSRNEFQIRIPDRKLTKEEWNEILEYIGENTEGGHSYGWRMETIGEPQDSPFDGLKHFKWPAGLIAGTEELGEEHTFVERLI